MKEYEVTKGLRRDIQELQHDIDGAHERYTDRIGEIVDLLCETRGIQSIAIKESIMAFALEGDTYEIELEIEEYERNNEK